MYIHVCLHMCVHIQVNMYLYVHVNMYLYVHTFIYMHIHIHKYSYLQDMYIRVYIYKVCIYVAICCSVHCIVCVAVSCGRSQ